MEILLKPFILFFFQTTPHVSEPAKTVNEMKFIPSDSPPGLFLSWRVKTSNKNNDWRKRKTYQARFSSSQLFLTSGWKICLQSAGTCLQIIKAFTHTNPIRSLANHKRWQSWGRLEGQIRAVCWGGKAQHYKSEIPRNAQQQVKTLRCS